MRDPLGQARSRSEREKSSVEVPQLDGVQKANPHAVESEWCTNGEVDGCGCCLSDPGWSCVNVVIICNASIVYKNNRCINIPEINVYTLILACYVYGLHTQTHTEHYTQRLS